MASLGFKLCTFKVLLPDNGGLPLKLMRREYHIYVSYMLRMCK